MWGSTPANGRPRENIRRNNKRISESKRPAQNKWQRASTTTDINVYKVCNAFAANDVNEWNMVAQARPSSAWEMELRTRQRTSISCIGISNVIYEECKRLFDHHWITNRLKWGNDFFLLLLLVPNATAVYLNGDLVAGRQLCLGVNSGRWTYLECFSMLNSQHCPDFFAFHMSSWPLPSHACTMLQRKSRPHCRYSVHAI